MQAIFPSHMKRVQIVQDTAIRSLGEYLAVVVIEIVLEIKIF